TRKRGVTKDRGDDAPQTAIGEGRAPVGGEQDADIGRNALAALEVEPDWKDVAEKSTEPGDQSRAVVNEITREQDGGSAFQKIAKQRRGGEFLVSGAQH